LEDPAIVRARLDVKSIEQAVTAYYLINGMWPQDLVALTKPDVTGRPPLIKAPLPKDPWGNDYIYQPQNLNPKTDRPLIYSEGPPGHIIRITNWD
jgi:hypothetical protein